MLLGIGLVLMLIQWHITQDIEEIDGFNLIATKNSLYSFIECEKNE